MVAKTYVETYLYSVVFWQFLKKIIVARASESRRYMLYCIPYKLARRRTLDFKIRVIRNVHTEKQQAEDVPPIMK